MQHIWTEDTVRLVREDLLINSVIKFRRILAQLHDGRSLHTDGSIHTGGYVGEIRRGVRLMEAELERRDIDVEVRMEAWGCGEPRVRRATETNA